MYLMNEVPIPRPHIEEILYIDSQSMNQLQLLKSTDDLPVYSDPHSAIHTRIFYLLQLTDTHIECRERNRFMTRSAAVSTADESRFSIHVYVYRLGLYLNCCSFDINILPPL